MRSYMFIYEVYVSSFHNFICTCMYLIYNYEVLIMRSYMFVLLQWIYDIEVPVSCFKTFLIYENKVLIMRSYVFVLLQWVYILDVVHKVLCWCGISSVDPALTAEVVLRLALVFESSAHIDEGRSPQSTLLYRGSVKRGLGGFYLTTCKGTSTNDGDLHLKVNAHFTSSSLLPQVNGFRGGRCYLIFSKLILRGVGYWDTCSTHYILFSRIFSKG